MLAAQAVHQKNVAISRCLVGIAQSAWRNGVCVAAVAVDVGVVGGQFVEGRGAIVVERDGVGRGIVGVVADASCCRRCASAACCSAGKRGVVGRALLLWPSDRER